MISIYKKLFNIISIVIIISNVFPNSRIAFSRPGNMMRTPSQSYYENNPHLFHINASSEIVNFSKNNRVNSSISIETQNSMGTTFGFSISKTTNTANSNEIGFHLQKIIFSHGNVSITTGIHDILYKPNGDETLKINDMSFFGVLTSYKNFNDYNLTINFGGGSGKLQYDPHTNSNSQETAGIFLGFNLNTPYLYKNGGIDLIFEFDGLGINLGTNIPFTDDYAMSFGITHFENLGEFGTESLQVPDNKTLQPDAPAFTIGLSMMVPRIQLKNNNNLIPFQEQKNNMSEVEKNLTDIIYSLRDSLNIATNQLNSILNENTYLSQKVSVLMDSSRVYHLERQIDQSNLNKVSRHLTRCLRYFYSKEYREALAEADKAIEINPSIAIAYARKGSIYYKLGEYQRATMNWNIALKLDPEFIEIQEILLASKENRLQSAELNEENN